MSTLVVTHADFMSCLTLDEAALAVTEQAFTWIEEVRVAMSHFSVSSHDVPGFDERPGSARRGGVRRFPPVDNAQISGLLTY
jgi:hypothetical protein